MKNNKKILIVGIITLLVMVGVIGGAFAFFIFANTGENQVLVAGDVFMKYTESNTVINAELMMPRSSYDPETYFEFTIEGKNTHNKDLYYEILINEGDPHATRKTRLDAKFLRFRLEEIVGDEVTPVIEEGTYEEIDNTKIWVNTIKANTKTKTSIKYRLYMWITDEVNISASGDYTNEVWNNDVFASIKVSVNGDFEEKKIENTLVDSIKNAIKIHTTDTCTPTITDDNGTPEDPSDDTIYFSGTNDCVNFNYVWYSGKLWRITAINPDGSMKLVTQDAITGVYWGSNITYEGSWIYQWLNEDFKDTLYNYKEIIVKDADWNATADDSSTPARPDSNGTIVTGDVGLLNAYEYYQSYKNLGIDYSAYNNGYLNIGYHWWLITPNSSSSVRGVNNGGEISSPYPNSQARGVRPSINLKSNIGIVAGGDGSLANPYRINEDKEPGSSGELINTRLSGEYVKVDNKIYRIVGIDKDENGNNITKLTSVDYVRDGSEVLTKNFGPTSNWGDSVSSENPNNWGYYLNDTNDGTFKGTWLTEELNKYITKGTYYLGTVGNKSSYKNSICSASNTTAPTSTCPKTNSTWKEGLVGLPRMGEMFSYQTIDKTKGQTLNDMWLITPYSSSVVWYVDIYGGMGGNSSSLRAVGVRPSINLKSEVIITGGDGMSPDSAYTIGLPS